MVAPEGGGSAFAVTTASIGRLKSRSGRSERAHIAWERRCGGHGVLLCGIHAKGSQFACKNLHAANIADHSTCLIFISLVRQIPTGEKATLEDPIEGASAIRPKSQVAGVAAGTPDGVGIETALVPKETFFAKVGGYESHAPEFPINAAHSSWIGRKRSQRSTPVGMPKHVSSVWNDPSSCALHPIAGFEKTC